MSRYTLEEKVYYTQYMVKRINGFWIQYKGELFNHPEFWRETLHSFANEEWQIMLDVMTLIHLEDPTCYLPGSRDQFEEAQRILQTEGHSQEPRVLDRNRHKRTAFKTLMHIKDVFNRFQGYEAPTEFAPDPEPATQFELLFEKRD